MRRPAPKDEVSLRSDDTQLATRSTRRAAQPVANPSEQQERAFLVGVEFRTRGRGAGKLSSAAITPGAQAAPAHPASSPSPPSFPPHSPHFPWEKSLDEL